jgi:hypothetical protein
MRILCNVEFICTDFYVGNIIVQKPTRLCCLCISAFVHFFNRIYVKIYLLFSLLEKTFFFITFIKHIGYLIHKCYE